MTGLWRNCARPRYVRYALRNRTVLPDETLGITVRLAAPRLGRDFEWELSRSRGEVDVRMKGRSAHQAPRTVGVRLSLASNATNMSDSGKYLRFCASYSQCAPCLAMHRLRARRSLPPGSLVGRAHDSWNHKAR